MTDPNTIVTDEEIDAAWGNANFGSAQRRDVIDDTVLKIAGGYSTGSTAIAICRELGLLGSPRNPYNVALTKKGRLYLYWAYQGRIKPSPPHGPNCGCHYCN